MALQTPLCIKNDIVLSDSNSEGIAGLLIPVTFSVRQIRGKLELRADSKEDLRDLKQILARQPKATGVGMYAIEVTIYDAVDDELNTFSDRFSLDVIPAVMMMEQPGDMRLRWFLG